MKNGGSTNKALQIPEHLHSPPLIQSNKEEMGAL
jgi:hypothetical protein